MGSCSTIPTLTQTVATTTESTSIVVSSSVTTSPPTTSYITSIGTTCVPVRNISSCQTTTQVATSIIPGGVQTVEFTQTTVFPVTATVVNTLFATSCTGVSSGGGNPVSTTSQSTSSFVSPVLSTVTAMSSSTAANGSVLVTLVTETQTMPPTGSSTTGALNSNTNSTTAIPHIGAIIGGSVGGFFGLAALALLAWYLWKRNTRWDDIFEREEDAILRDAFPKPKRDPNLDPKPRPYEYGLVGHSSVPPHMSPPSSTGLSLSSDTAYNPVPNVTQHHQPYHHSVGQQSGAQQQQSIGQQQQSAAQQQSIGQQQQQSVMQQQQSAVQQQSVGQQLPQQQQQSVGPYAGQSMGQPAHAQVPSFSTHGHAVAAAAVASAIPRPAAVSLVSSLQEASSSASAPSGAWVGAGGNRYPPGVQYNTSATSSTAQPRPGTGQRESIVDEDEVYGGIAPIMPVVSHSGSNNVSAYSRGHSAGLSNAGPGPNAAEFNPYQERQRPVRERRGGKGQLITAGEKPPVVHLDGGRYREHVRASVPASIGSDSVMGPPAYSA